MNSDMVIENSITDNMKNIVYLFVKRVADMIVGLIGIIFLIPLTLIVKIISICTGDFKSIFFKQERIGKNGKMFMMYKYRTMIPNADEELFKLLKEDKKAATEYKKNKKLKNDPRITKAGKFLRKTSLDEFPQFINVFLGSMSLIGNRPYLPREIEDMGEYYKDIIKTKPGISGLWQVSGRSNIDFNERLKLEKKYSDIAGLRLDIKLFFKTIGVVVLKKGAK